MVETTKHIFVTGGVASSLGKGLTASSLGRLLRSRGLRVTMQKLDPYINVDPGTMNPFQHGEVFVTDDGAETDLDIGHYERFLDVNLVGSANVTTGQVYNHVIAKERRGEYLGDTVQVIPHITNEIVARMRALATGGPDAPDVIITEIGGTVGDIESLPFLEAARQVRHLIGRDNSFFLHVSLVPYLAPSGELKTKPTQHSVAALRQVGIQPDGLVLRADRDIPDPIKRKISLMCDVDVTAVAACVDAPSIYDIPKVLHREGLDAYVIRRLGLSFRDVDWTEWDQLLQRVHDPEHDIEIALVGKYIDLPDAYLSVTEALRAGGFHHDAKVTIRWVASDECQTPAGAQRALGGVDAVLVPGGFGVRGIEGKLGALTWAREKQVPTLGICLGLQCMVIEYARTVLGNEDASSTEFDPETAHPVIATMEEQKAFVEGAGDLGGTMRLGLYPAALKEGSVIREAYGAGRGQGAPPPPLRGQQLLPRRPREGGPRLLRHVARRHARRVRRAAARGPPLLRVDAGAPGVPVAPQPRAPALRGSRRGRPRAPAQRAARRGRAPPRRGRRGQAGRDAAARTGHDELRLGVRVGSPPRTPTEPRVSLDAPSGTGADLVEEWTAEPVLESTTPVRGDHLRRRARARRPRRRGRRDARLRDAPRGRRRARPARARRRRPRAHDPAVPTRERWPRVGAARGPARRRRRAAVGGRRARARRGGRPDGRRVARARRRRHVTRRVPRDGADLPRPRPAGGARRPTRTSARRRS